MTRNITQKYRKKFAKANNDKFALQESAVEPIIEDTKTL